MKYMLLLLPLLLPGVLCVEYSIESLAEQTNIPIQNLMDCMESSNATTDMVVQVLNINRRTEQNDLLPNARKMGCFLVCIFRYKGLVRGSQLNLVPIQEKFTKFIGTENQAFLDVINKCSTAVKNEQDECIASFVLIFCIGKHLE